MCSPGASLMVGQLALSMAAQLPVRDVFLMARLEHADEFHRETVGNTVSLTWNIK